MRSIRFILRLGWRHSLELASADAASGVVLTTTDWPLLDPPAIRCHAIGGSR